jgi:fluoride exporter
MLLVGFGGVFGAIARFLLGKWISTKAQFAFPFGTLIINIGGSFLLGILATLHINHEISDSIWLLLGTGFLGAYTTFSTFGYETLQMLERKAAKEAILYTSTSVLLGVVFAWFGSLLANFL